MNTYKDNQAKEDAKGYVLQFKKFFGLTVTEKHDEDTLKLTISNTDHKKKQMV